MKFNIAREQELLTIIPQLIERKLSAKEISQELNISRTTVHRYCVKLGINIPNHHNALKFNNTIFDSIDTEEKAYWLGFLFADGGVSSTSNVITLSLKRDDLEHLEKFNAFVENKNPIRLYNVKLQDRKYPACSINLCNAHFKNTLRSLGCIEQKSLKLEFPDISIFEDPKLVYDFIRGYVDGDGCLSFSRNGRLSLQILGTYNFLSGLKLHFPNSFGKVTKIKRLKTNTYTIQNTGKKADEVASILYKNAKIYLTRKYNRFVVLGRNT